MLIETAPPAAKSAPVVEGVPSGELSLTNG